MSIIYEIADQIFVGSLGIVSFHNRGKYGIEFSETMNSVYHITEKVKRK